jgi:thiamine biosynthesis lipoprotein
MLCLMTRLTFQHGIEAMATRFEVWLRGDDAQHLEAVAVMICEEIQRLAALLSRYDQRSEIARVNRERTARVDRELFALLERCEQARVETEGYFDVTLGAALQLDRDTCTVRLTQAVALVDLGAVGKGYALDVGRAIALRYGVTSGLLQGGTSSILAFGNDTWPIEVRHPLWPERIVTRLALVNRGFSCSAVRHAAQAQSDVVNPQTGEPLTSDEACYVLAASATEAEIYSTALLAMGRERALAYSQEKHLETEWINV